ncbi:MAG TPA: DUF1989 domain-containing protein [Stellaceae bacterium]|nr:DUF1989 domain-containing protein [Stellaceae bacterium]
MTSLTTIPARKGKAALLRQGEVLRLINTHGGQVVDTWAFCRDDLGEYIRWRIRTPSCRRPCRPPATPWSRTGAARC